MPRNSSGTYALPAGNPVVTNTLIQSTWANTTLSDVSTAMTDSLDRNGRGAMLAPLKNIDGTATAPALSFSSEGTMGIYRASAGVLGFAVGGALVLSLASSGLTFTTPLVLPIGSAAAPSLTFTSNTNTGIYSPATNQVAVTTQGVQRLLVDGGGTVAISSGLLVLSLAGSNTVRASDAAGLLVFQTGGSNTRFTIDASGSGSFNGNFGIGTTPTVRLQTAGTKVIFQSGTANQGIVQFGTGDTSHTISAGADFLGMQLSVLNAIQFLTGSTPTERMRIDAAGNVGVAVTPSAWGSTIRAIQFPGGAVYGTTASQLLSANTYFDGTNNRYVAAGAATQYQQSSGAHFWFNATSGAANAVMTPTTAMTLDASGNLGIGVTPTVRLQTFGTRVIFGEGGPNQGTLQFGTGNTLHYISAGTDYTGMQFSVTQNMIWLTGATPAEHMRLDSGGKLGLGTTPTVLLDLFGSGNPQINLLGSGSYSTVLNMGAAGGGAAQLKSGGNFLFFPGGVQLASLDTAGNFSVLGTLLAANGLQLSSTGTTASVISHNNTTGNLAIVANATLVDSTARFELYDTAHATLAKQAFYRGDVHTWTKAAAATTVMSITAAGVIQDGAGIELGWKDIPTNSQAGPYTLVVGDRGKLVQVAATSATVPASVFSQGATVSIFNNSAGSISIVQGASVTLYFGATGGTGNRTLGARGIATVVCLGSNTFVITGAGLT